MSTGPTSTREAMNRLVLGEIDGLTARMEALAAELGTREQAAAEAIGDAAAKLAEAATALPAQAQATAEAAITQRAREQWTILGAVASRAASEAATAAVKAFLESNPSRPARPLWLLPLVGAIVLAQFALTAVVLASMPQ